MNRLIEQAIEIWTAGGWGMILLAINGFLLFAVGLNVWFSLKRRRFRGIPETEWKTWIADPAKRRGPLGRVIDFVMGASDLDDIRVRFNELNGTEIAPFKRDLRFLKRAVSTAPLLGLLGTVTGMLTTFHALASGSGGDKTMDMVAQGISEALITTETGLVIAVPGLFFVYHLTRERDRYAAFLAHLETVCTQHLYRTIAGTSRREA